MTKLETTEQNLSKDQIHFGDTVLLFSPDEWKFLPYKINTYYKLEFIHGVADMGRGFVKEYQNEEVLC